jgi:MoxR-like ATPase
MSDALKRRCLHLFIDFPSEELEVRILEAKVPEAGLKLNQDLARMMQGLREMDLKKSPSISETLDWARALLALNAKELDRDVVTQTLNVILKYQGDVRKAEGELDKLLAKRGEDQRPDTGTVTTSAGGTVTSPTQEAGKDALRRA